MQPGPAPAVPSNVLEITLALALAATHLLAEAQHAPPSTLPSPWGGDWTGWRPQHDAFDQAHLRWAARYGCDECAAERRAERERDAEPPLAAAPERVGNFLIHRDHNRPRRSQ